MSDHDWSTMEQPSIFYVWTTLGKQGRRVVEYGTRAELDARWDALRVAYPDAWMTEDQMISRTRVVRGVKA